jgi:hypothetical protein
MTIKPWHTSESNTVSYGIDIICPFAGTLEGQAKA